MRLQGKGRSESSDCAQPDFLFPARLDLLKKVLGEICDLGQLLLRQAVAQAEFAQALPDLVNRVHPSDRR